VRGAPRAVRVTSFLLSLLVVGTMAALSVYVASRWERYESGDTHAVFLATAGVWLLALVALGIAGATGRAWAFVLSLVLFLLVLVGEVVSYVAFTVT
jgi:hypothetical protein